MVRNGRFRVGTAPWDFLSLLHPELDKMSFDQSKTIIPRYRMYRLIYASRGVFFLFLNQIDANFIPFNKFELIHYQNLGSETNPVN